MKYQDIIDDLESRGLKRYAFTVRKLGAGYDEVGRNIRYIKGYDFGEGVNPFEVMEEAFSEWGDPNPKAPLTTNKYIKRRYRKRFRVKKGKPDNDITYGTGRKGNSKKPAP